MKQIRAFWEKIKHIWIPAALLLALCLAAGWAWLNDVRPAAGNILLERVNEDYTVTTEPLQAGDALCQPFTAPGDIYGGSFVFTIYNEVCYGTLTLEVQDESGTVLASKTVDTTTLLDNTYRDIVFDSAVPAQKGGHYAYVLRFSPGAQGGRLGLWASAGAVAGQESAALNGTALGQTLGFSIVTNRVGGWLKAAYAGFVLFAAAGLILGWWLLFIKKAGLIPCFVYFSLVLGILFVFVMPPYIAPDEEIHIHTAYHYSNVLMGISDGDGLMMRAVDTGTFDHSDTVSAFSYQTAARDAFGRCSDASLQKTDYTTTGSFFLQYLPAALGVTLARLLGFNYVTLIWFGRLFSLLAYTALMALAIRIMPQYKRILACIGLLPMCLHLAASFNYDAMLIAAACIFTALVLHDAVEKESLRWRDLALLAAAAVLLAPMKMLYVLLVGICLIIPAKKCPGRARWLVLGLVVLAVGFFVCFSGYILTYVGLSRGALAAAAAKAVPQVNPDNVSYVETDFWNLAYVLTHLSGTFKLLAGTVQQNTALYFTQLVGGELGEPILNDLLAWTPAVWGLWLVLAGSAVPSGEEKPLLGRGAKSWCALVLLGLGGALLIVTLGWTPLRSTTLWGMQGRYWLPCLPLTLLVFQGDGLRLKRDITGGLLTAEYCLGLLTALSVFQCILAQ